MNKINLRGSAFLEKYRLLKTPLTAFRRNYAKDDKDKDDKELEIEEQYKARKGVLHDKQQSIQEESYFHKEAFRGNRLIMHQLQEMEQLKGLKKKLKEAEEKKKNEEK